MQPENFEPQLAALLQGAGRGTAAELVDTMSAYWTGSRLVFVNVDTVGTGALAGKFELDAQRWAQWKEWLSDWLMDPVLSVRHDLHDEP